MHSPFLAEFWLGNVAAFAGVRLHAVKVASWFTPGDVGVIAECWLPLLKHIRQRSKLCQVYRSGVGALCILHEPGGTGLLLLISETLTPEQG